MSKDIQAIRGMNDILPQEVAYWQFLEDHLRKLAAQYGYEEIRTPMLERTELFARSIGEATDIVEKEMYTFADRNQESLTLRPEGTAGCVRAVIEHNLLRQQVQRLWYLSPSFRHERPQKGRYRQFYQFGVEAFGFPGPDIDAEMILMSARLLRKLNIINEVELQINSLGTLESRKRYREVLVAYFSSHHQELDEDSKRRIVSNPLRILDSKNPQMQELISQAPQFTEYLDATSQAHLQTLLGLIEPAGINYIFNPRLVRGLDYYTGTVFEWVTKTLGAQGTICAGGRYDSLFELLGNEAVPAIGFALGCERVLEMIKTKYTIEEVSVHPDIYFILLGDGAQEQGLNIAEMLRDHVSYLKIVVNCDGGSFKSQFKRADKSNARIALIIAESELEHKTVSIKFLREEREQITIAEDDLIEFLQDEFAVHG